MLYAHTPNAAGEWHSLEDHLRAVAELAAGYAASFGGEAAADWLGWWHDAGKAHPDFQRYLQACAAQPGFRPGTVDHKGAGTLAAIGDKELLAFIVHGHHGGLPDKDGLEGRFNDLKSGQPGERARAVLEQPEIGSLIPIAANAPVRFPEWLFGQDRFAVEMFIRMLFSALVDADHLDTERHRNPEIAAKRGEAGGLAPLLDKLLAGQAALSGKDTDQLGVIRHAVYQRCLSLAGEPQGFFRLSAPTGSGKTRSAMAFALAHALGHGQQRVISVAPYLTITDQTADVYREIFGEWVILEHHSDANRNDDRDGAQTGEAEWRRLTSQTWDSPVIVTTAVQFFESLFSNKPTACRKLHRIAGSVIVLDEPQTFPSNLLEPIASALQILVAHFGASVLFCTATQPAMERVPAFANLPPATELAPDPPALFRALKRVEYVWPDPGAIASWDEIASLLRENHQGMAVLNTRKDAMALLDALADPEALHLSTYLCGAHRRDVLERVRKRLTAKEACRLISTQVVEAGVDLDFPVVLRGMGPLDRIVQAAGRCNREGNLEAGSVIVFRPGEGKLPAGPYRTATDTTEMLLRRGLIDPDDPATFARYFQLLYQNVDLDGKKVQPVRMEFQFEEVARRFHLIDDAGESVIVEYDAPDKNQHGQIRQHKDIVQGLVAELMNAITHGKGGLPREIMRKLQPYIVSVRPYALARLAGEGVCKNLTDGVWLWTARYDELRGIGGAIEAKYEPADLIA